MNVQVTGKRIDVGESLRSYVTTKLTTGVAKYFDRAAEVAVTFSREAHQFRADCLVRIEHGLVLRSHGFSSDVYASFDEAEEHMEKRLRRYKGRLQRHRGAQRNHEMVSQARDIVFSVEEEHEVEPETFLPVTIAETTTEIPTISVGEAVMRLDLEQSTALMFRNSAHGELNVVYRRADGNIGWIDPSGL